MSKNFEEEYKNLAKKELPDLWNRIEAGLTPRPNGVCADHETYTEQSEKAFEKQQVQNEKKPGRKPVFWYKYKSVLVAAICVIVILPTILLFSTNEKASKGSANESAAAMGADEALEETTVEEATVEETAVEEAATEDMVVEETADIAEDMTESSTETMEENVVETLEKSKQESASEEEREARKDMMTDTAGTSPTSMQLDKVTVQLKTSEEISAEDGGGVLYTVTIGDDPTDTFAVGSELLLFNPSHSSTVLLDVGKNYLVKIKYDEQEKYPYSLAVLYEEIKP